MPDGPGGAPSDRSSADPTDPTRSPSWRTRLAVVAGAAIIAVLAVGSPLWSDQVLLTDSLVDVAPWDGALPGAESSHLGLLSDTVDTYEPLRQVTADGLARGELVRWNRYPTGGAPLGTDLSWASMTPYLALDVALGPTEAPGWRKAIELVVAMLGTYGFCRLVGMHRLAAGLGGVAFAFCGFQLAWTGWPHTRVAAWGAVAMWLAERVVQRRRPVDVAALGIVVAFVVLEGYPPVAASFLGLVVSWVAVRTWPWRDRRVEPADGDVRPDGAPSRSGWRSAAAVAGGLVLGLALAGAQLVPFVVRTLGLDLDRGQTGLPALPPERLLTLVAPFAWGNDADGSAFGNRTALFSNAFLGAGATVLVLVALLGPWSVRVPRRLRWWALAVAAVLVALVYVGGAPLDLARQLPVLGETRIERFRGVLGFVLAVLAAAGAESLLDPAARSATARWWRPAVLVGVGVATAWAVRLVVDGAIGADHLAATLTALALAAATVVAAVAGLVLARRRPDLARVVVAGFVLVAAVEGIAVAQAWFPRTDPDRWYPTTATHEFLVDHDGDRVAPSGTTLLAGTAVHWGIRTVNGSVFAPASWRQALEAVDPDTYRASQAWSLLGPGEDVATSPVLDRLAVRWWVAPAGELAPDPDGLLRVAHEADGVVVLERRDALPRVRFAGRAVVERYGDRRLELLAGGLPADVVLLHDGEADDQPGDGVVLEAVDLGDRQVIEVDGGTSGGWVVVADALQSDWAATLDGQPTPLLPAEHALVAVAVPSGRHTIELAVDPAGWTAGRGLTVAGLAVALGLVGASLRGHRRRRRATLGPSTTSSPTETIPPTPAATGRRPTSEAP